MEPPCGKNIKFMLITQDGPDEIQDFLHGLSPAYRFPSLNRAIAPRSANWARA